MKNNVKSYDQTMISNFYAISFLICFLIMSCSIVGCSGASDESPAVKHDEATSPTESQKPEEPGKCGDGVCDTFERERGICPEDCSRDNSTGIREPGIVYVGLMVHLEGWDDEIHNETKFRAHASEARELAYIFEKYGAKVTFEARPEFVQGCKVWNDNVLQELYDRGHGVGVHADIGYYPANSDYDLKQFTSDLRKMRLDMEDLVNFDIQHVSGICSDLDWAEAAIEAGYVFTTGGVGYCCQSMPVDIRPEEYKVCRSPAHCHGNMPLDMEDRIHPWRISTAKGDWTSDDPNGELINLASDSGIKNLYEETLDPSQTYGDMDYSAEDIAVLVEKVEQAISLSNGNKVNIIYFSLSIGAADVNSDFYSKMFEALQSYVDAGQIGYKTINEMYEEYVSMI